MNTPDKATQIKAVVTAALLFLTELWGWVGWALIIWIVCVVLDYISGTAAARRSGINKFRSGPRSYCYS